MRYLSCCSGIEAATVAWHPLGWKAVGFSEIEPFPCAVLAHRFPNTPNYGDLTQYQSWPLSAGDVDLIISGTPCQSFSVAGLRKGLADPRGNLALVALGLVDKLQPKYFLWENVGGVLSSNGGRDFGSFLGALVQLGYGFAYRVLDAQYVGRCPMHASGTGWETVPQRRRRVFVLAVKGPGGAESAAKILSLSEGVRGYLEKGKQTRKGTPAGPQGGPGAESRLFDMQAIGAYGDTGTASTLKRRDYKDATDLIVDPVCATGEITHCLTASQKGATEDGTGRGTPIVIDRAAFNQGENAQYEPHIEQTETMDTLVSRGPHAVGVPLMFKVRGGSPVETGEQGGTPGRVAGKGFLGSEDKAFTIAAVQDQWLAQPVGSLGDVAHTLTKSYHSSEDGTGRGTPIISQAIPLDSMNLLSRLGPGGENHSLQNFVPGDPMFTLTKAQHHAVAQPSDVQPPMAVRRLTPEECEALQGFEKGHTRIPWNGKPAEECPDGPRYKACGNSMATPVIRWIGLRIQQFEDGTLDQE